MRSFFSSVSSLPLSEVRALHLAVDVVGDLFFERVVAILLRDCLAANDLGEQVFDFRVVLREEEDGGGIGALV